MRHWFQCWSTVSKMTKLDCYKNRSDHGVCCMNHCMFKNHLVLFSVKVLVATASPAAF